MSTHAELDPRHDMIASMLMGWTAVEHGMGIPPGHDMPAPVPAYSSSLDAAIDILTMLDAIGYAVSCYLEDDHRWYIQVWLRVGELCNHGIMHTKTYSGYAATLPDAVVEVAVKVISTRLPAQA